MMNFSRKRLIVLLAAGSLLVLTAVFYIQFVLLRPIGSGPAGTQVASEPFSKQWTDRPVRVVGIGDSITAGLGARSTDQTFFNRLEAYRVRLTEMLGKIETCFPGGCEINIGDIYDPTDGVGDAPTFALHLSAVPGTQSVRDTAGIFRNTPTALDSRAQGRDKVAHPGCRPIGA